MMYWGNVTPVNPLSHNQCCHVKTCRFLFVFHQVKLISKILFSPGSNMIFGTDDGKHKT